MTIEKTAERDDVATEIRRGLSWEVPDGDRGLALARKIVAGTITAQEIIRELEPLGVWWGIESQYGGLADYEAHAETYDHSVSAKTLLAEHDEEKALAASLDRNVIGKDYAGRPWTSTRKAWEDYVDGLTEQWAKGPGERWFGCSVPVVLTAKRPKHRDGTLWDPSVHNESNGLMGNSYLPDGQPLEITEVRYSPDFETYKVLRAGGIRTTAKTAADILDDATKQRLLGDPDTKRLYAVEQQLKARLFHFPQKSIADLQRLADTIGPKILVMEVSQPGVAGTGLFGGKPAMIGLGPDMRDEATLIHEMTHVQRGTSGAAPTGSPDHGPDFLKHYLRLLRKHCTNPEYAKMLSGNMGGRYATVANLGSRLWWRVHPEHRGDLMPEMATSKPFFESGSIEEFKGRPEQGYSAFDDPWHLWLYVWLMWGWDGMEDSRTPVLGFTGTRVGTGADGEDLVMPSGGTVQTFTVREFFADLMRTPLPATPVFAPWVPGALRYTSDRLTSWEALAKRLAWLDQGDPVHEHIVRTFAPQQKASSREMTWEQVRAKYPVYAGFGMNFNVEELALGAPDWDGQSGTEGIRYVEEQVPVDKVRFARRPLGDDRTRALLDAAQQGRAVPPVLVVRRAGELLVSDGNHRLTVAEELGHPTIPAVVAISPRTDRYAGRGAVGYAKVASTTALPSWRDRGVLPSVECVIAPDLGRASRNSYLVYLYDQPFARRPTLSEAKASVEEIYGPLDWQRIEGDPDEHHDHVWGWTTMFNDAPYYLLVERLPRLGATAAMATTLGPQRVEFEPGKWRWVRGEWAESSIPGIWLAAMLPREGPMQRVDSEGPSLGAFLGKEGQYIGHIYWDRDSGEVTDIWVNPSHQRKGVGTMLWQEAKNRDPKVRHSEIQTSDGKAWSQHVGAKHTVTTGDFEGITFDYDHIFKGKRNGRDYYMCREHGNIYSALTHPEARLAGHLTVVVSANEIGAVSVHRDHQRQGIATEMLRMAREDYPGLAHTTVPGQLSPNGEAWSKVVGARQPLRGGTIYRGLRVDLPADVDAKVTDLLKMETDEESYARWKPHGGKKVQAGELIVRALEKSHWDSEMGLGRHWSTRREMAATAAQQGGHGDWAILLTATYSPDDVDPDWDPEGAFMEQEDEVRLRPGAKITVTQVDLLNAKGFFESKGTRVSYQPIRATASAPLGHIIERRDDPKYSTLAYVVPGAPGRSDSALEKEWVGSIVFADAGPEGLWVFSRVTDPDYRRQGVMTALQDRLEQIAAGRPIHSSKRDFSSNAHAFRSRYLQKNPASTWVLGALSQVGSEYGREDRPSGGDRRAGGALPAGDHQRPDVGGHRGGRDHHDRGDRGRTAGRGRGPAPVRPPLRLTAARTARFTGTQCPNAGPLDRAFAGYSSDLKAQILAAINAFKAGKTVAHEKERPPLLGVWTIPMGGKDHTNTDGRVFVMPVENGDWVAIYAITTHEAYDLAEEKVGGWLRSANAAAVLRRQGSIRTAAGPMSTKEIYSRTDRIRDHVTKITFPQAHALLRKVLTDARFPSGELAYADESTTHASSYIGWDLDETNTRPPTPVVYLHRRSMTQLVLLHEAAHLLWIGRFPGRNPGYSTEQVHDQRWFDIWADLVHRYADWSTNFEFDRTFGFITDELWEKGAPLVMRASRIAMNLQYYAIDWAWQDRLDRDAGGKGQHDLTKKRTLPLLDRLARQILADHGHPDTDVEIHRQRIGESEADYNPDLDAVFLTFDDDMRTKWVLLHEMAHALDLIEGSDEMVYLDDHGFNFKRRFTALLKRYGGIDVDLDSRPNRLAPRSSAWAPFKPPAGTKIETGGDAVPGGYNGYFVAYDVASGEKMGYLDYQSARGYGVTIAMIEVEPKWRRKGVATVLLDALRNDFPDEEIDPGYTTSDGAAWWSRVRGRVAKVATANLRFEHLKDHYVEGLGDYPDASERFFTPYADVLVAYDGSRAVGHIMWFTNPVGLTEGGVDIVYVDPAYQRRGIATELLRRAKAIDPRVDPMNTPWFTDDGEAWVRSL